MSEESAENEPAPNLWDLLENENGGDDIREKILTDLVQRTVDKLRRKDDGEDLALCSTNSANYGICRAIWNRAWAQERAHWEGEQVPADNTRQDIPFFNRAEGFARILDLIKRRDGVELTSELPTDMSLQKAYKHLRGAREWAPRHWQPNRQHFQSRTELRVAVERWCRDEPGDRDRILETYGHPEAWIVTGIADFSQLIHARDGSHFNEPIGAWDTIHVQNMTGLFHTNHRFNQYIGKWNVRNVLTMESMFHQSYSFNQPIGDWNVSSCQSMFEMFCMASAFNQPIGKWITDRVLSMAFMFQEARAFNQPIEDWNVRAVGSMNGMFNNAKRFNQPLNGWGKTFRVINISEMFKGATRFNQPLNAWDTSRVQFAVDVFLNASKFVQDLSNWILHPGATPRSKTYITEVKEQLQAKLAAQRSRSGTRTLRSATRAAGTNSVVDELYSFHGLLLG